MRDIEKTIEAIGKAACLAAKELARLSSDIKNKALYTIAKAIRTNANVILAANQKDLECAVEKNLSPALIDRLRLTEARLEAIAKSLEIIASLPDPVGRVLMETVRPNGLIISRISVPLGVIGVIYESRPNVTTDAAGLCLKSGNAVILRGGSESFHSSQALLQLIQQGLNEAGITANAVQMIPTTNREAVNAMLALTNDIDVIIPRGGPKLIEFISAHTRIPLFKHLAGICHTYIHRSADKEMAKTVVLNAKMRRTGICGATEVLLIDRAILHTHLQAVLETLHAAHCTILGDAEVVALDSRVHLAKETDFATEFLDAIIAVKVVNDIDAAIQQIATHGTKHTEAIIAQDKQAAEKFLREVDSAIVMHNTSTQFADGGEFGMGAEMGIATGKLHARGPVGLEQLTTFKYLVRGNGQVR